MFYEVENCPESVSFEQLDSVIAFTLDALDFDVDATLIITFDDDLEANQCGYFEYDEDEGELYISISHTLRGEEMIRTIMHELVHARQILTGEYVPGEGNIPGTWNDVMYTCDYMDLPWEKEAYALEEIIYAQYIGN